MFISIIIPTYNRNDLLEVCLNVLTFENQNLSSNDYEIIVSDDSPTFDAKILIEEKFQWVVWLEGPHRGPAANRNNGAKYAKGEWIVFIDDDCIPDKDLIKNYQKAINNNPNILAFEGCIKADRPKRHFLEESPINEAGGYFWSCNIMIQRDYFFNNLHGFDEDFPYAAMEDMDLRERIKEDNQSIAFVKDALVIHPWRIHKEILKFTKEKRWMSNALFYSKHPHLRSSKSLYIKIKKELRFYVKNILLNVIRYRGRGLFTYIRFHILHNKGIQKSV
jgi:GT2 family glycosyltransferase